ncbi:MAG: HAD family hydrolase, partial [Lactobacillaceae bacterium]
LNRSKLKQIYQYIPQNLLNETTATFSSNRYLEFNEVGVNKGKGLLELAKILKIKPKEIVAIGDNTNDLSMIKVAGLGIAVQNATPDVKHAATYITQADYKHDAVNEAIEKFILS